MGKPMYRRPSRGQGDELCAGKTKARETPTDKHYCYMSAPRGTVVTSIE